MLFTLIGGLHTYLFLGHVALQPIQTFGGYQNNFF